MGIWYIGACMQHAGRCGGVLIDSREWLNAANGMTVLDLMGRPARRRIWGSELVINYRIVGGGGGLGGAESLGRTSKSAAFIELSVGFGCRKCGGSGSLALWQCQASSQLR